MRLCELAWAFCLDAASVDVAARVRRREAVLLGVGFAFLALNAIVIGFHAFRWNVAGEAGVLLLPPVWALAAWVLHRSFERTLPERDPILLPSGMLLMGWGVLVVWRLIPEFGARQLVWFLAVTSVLYEIARMRSAT